MLSHLISASNGNPRHDRRSSNAQYNSPKHEPTGAMSVSEEKPIRPTYAPDLFLNREAEIDRFDSQVDDVIRGVAGIRRVLVIEGERGVGKSWLLKHLHWLTTQRTDVASYLVRFEPQYTGDAAHSTPQITLDQRVGESIITCNLNDFAARPEHPDDHSKHQLRGLLEGIAAYLLSAKLIAEKLPTALSLDETSLSLARMLRSALQIDNSVFVLLVDSAYEADWSFVAGLEDYVLAPLVAIDRVVVVLTGRGRPFPWINSLLRFEPMHGALQRWGEQEGADDVRDKHWDWIVQLVQTQVEKNNFWHKSTTLVAGETLKPVQKARLREIWRLAQGQPLLTVRLAEKTEGDGSADDAEILDEFINAELLDMLHDDKRNLFRNYLEALCVLDFFRETEAEIMIQAYFEMLGRDSESKSGREVLLVLQQTYLVRWDWRKTQYLVDDTARVAIDGWLRSAKLEQWLELHAVAQTMYSKWADVYPQHAEYYRGRAKRHKFVRENPNYSGNKRPVQEEVVD